MRRPWIHLSNFILANTEGSYFKFLTASTFHYDRLKAKQSEKFFKDLYLAYEPLHTAFNDAYSAWKAAGGIEKWGTYTLDEALDKLQSEWIQDWDLAVQGQFKRKSGEYKALLPHFRVPFQSGKDQERIEAVKAFSKALEDFSVLATLKAEVDAKLAIIKAAQEGKAAKQGVTEADSTQVEAARVAGSIGMYKNFALLCAHFADQDLQQVAQYIDEVTLRTTQQTHFTSDVNPKDKETVAKRGGLDPQDTLVWHNVGPVVLGMWASAHKDGEPPAGAPVFEVAAGDEKHMSVAEFGLTKATPYIIVSNSDTQEGRYELDIK